MRVTQSMLSSQMLYDISNNNQRLLDLQNEAATGNKINKPSDDPIGVGFLMQYKQESAYDQQYATNSQTAQSTLTFSGNIMNEATTVLQRARDLAIQGANGAETAADRQNIGAEVNQLYQQMVTIGNSQYNGSYIFNGQNTTTQPYSSTNAESNTTDNGQLLVDLGNGVNLNVNVSGSQFFGSPSDSDNAFGVLKQLTDALNNNDSSTINGLLTKLDSRVNTMLASQADVGARIDRAQLMQNRMGDLTQSLQTLVSNTQDADLAAVITNMNTAQAVQTASLEIGAKVIQPSLVDFLK